MTAYRTIPLSDGQVLEIHLDESPESPREWDNLGTMVCFHSRYDLGDKTDYKMGDFAGWENLKDQIVKDNKPAVIMPLYLLDHSGIAISCDSDMFRMCDPDGWDWGCVGFVFVSKDKVRENFNIKRLSPKWVKRAWNILLSEVGTYNQFLAGDIFGFVLKDKDGKMTDNCWGFYGGDPLDNGMSDHLPHEVVEEIKAVLV